MTKIDIAARDYIRNAVNEHGEFSLEGLRLVLLMSGRKPAVVDKYCGDLIAKGLVVAGEGWLVRLTVLGRGLAREQQGAGRRTTV